MKNGFIKIISLLSGMILLSDLTCVNSYAYQKPSQYFNNKILNNTNADIDWTLYESFLKYDLCITDYNNLTEEEKELCRFIFETERSDFPNVRCERARRILDNREVTERLTLEDIQDIGSIIDPDFPLKCYTCKRVFSVPDIIYSDYEYEYWVDDDGNKRILFDEFNDYIEYIEFYDTLPEKIDENVLLYEYDKNREKYILYQQIDLDKTVVTTEYVSDIWTYIILPDDTALIINSSLPKGKDVMPVDELVSVPAKLDGHIVSGLYYAFDNTGITKLIISDNIKHLGRLSNLQYLTDLTINSSELRMQDIVTCPELKNVSLNVKEMSCKTFVDCNKLENVNIVGAEQISSYAFEDCENLTSLTLPKNLEIIGQKAFANTALTEITIPENTRIIGAVSPSYIDIWYDEIIDTLKITDGNIVDKDCTIKGYYNTEAHKYTLANKLNFYSLDENISYGDINNDGNINIADAVGLQKYILGNGSAGFAADMNRDGIIDVFDMVIMRQKLITFV